MYWIGMFTCNIVGKSKNTSKIKIKEIKLKTKKMR